MLQLHCKGASSCYRAAYLERDVSRNARALLRILLFSRTVVLGPRSGT
jgi:hypothetical protein